MYPTLRIHKHPYPSLRMHQQGVRNMIHFSKVICNFTIEIYRRKRL